MPSRAPVRFAKWLGLAYGGAVALVFLWGADAPDVLLSGVLVVPWIVGPAALAAVGAAESRGGGGAWAFAGLEAGLAASTGLSWAWLIFVAPDAQNGFAMLIWIPLAQYVALGLFYALARLFGWRAHDEGAKEG